MKQNYHIPHLPLPYDLETKEVLKQVNRANMKLAELSSYFCKKAKKEERKKSSF